MQHFLLAILILLFAIRNHVLHALRWKYHFVRHIAKLQITVAVRCIDERNLRLLIERGTLDRFLGGSVLVHLI